MKTPIFKGMSRTLVMKALVICGLTALVFSCAGQRSVPEAALPEKPAPAVPPSRKPVPATPAPEKATPGKPVPERPTPLVVPPEKPVPVVPPPERFEPSEYIMGKGRVPEEKMALFLRQNNPEADQSFVLALAGFYVNEAAAEGVNHDTAFAQMCLETGFLSYGGLVTPDMNNFCGLGAIGPGQSGEIFPNPQTGVRAHIQHLKAYATTEPLNGVLVDPRYKWVQYGSSPTIHGLSGTWAADKNYSVKIGAILQRLYDFSFTPALAKGQ